MAPELSDADRQRWNQSYQDARPGGAPSSFLVEAAPPGEGGRALDVAGGRGRHAVWLAQRGYQVTLIDVSDRGLELAAEAARDAGVEVACARVDLESDPLPSGPWQLIVCFHYLQRSLFPAFARELAVGGRLLFCQPTVRNLERHPRPGERFLLKEGEAERLAVAAGLAVERCDEGWSDEGRHEARLIALRK